MPDDVETRCENLTEGHGEGHLTDSKFPYGFRTVLDSNVRSERPQRVRTESCGAMDPPSDANNERKLRIPPNFELRRGAKEVARARQAARLRPIPRKLSNVRSHNPCNARRGLLAGPGLRTGQVLPSTSTSVKAQCLRDMPGCEEFAGDAIEGTGASCYRQVSHTRRRNFEQA